MVTSKLTSGHVNYTGGKSLFEGGKSWFATVEEAGNEKSIVAASENPIVSLWFKQGSGRYGIKRTAGRYQYLGSNGKLRKSEGDHIISFSAMNIFMQSLFSYLPLEDFKSRIDQIFHPWIKYLNQLNEEFLELNKAKLNQAKGFFRYWHLFNDEFAEVKHLYDEIPASPLNAMSDDDPLDSIRLYMNAACTFYHKLPLIVFCDGPAAKGTNEREGMRKLRTLVDRTMSNTRPKAVLKALDDLFSNHLTDQNALKKLFDFATPESHPAIISHLISHLYLGFASTISPDKNKPIALRSNEIFRENLNPVICHFFGTTELANNPHFSSQIREALTIFQRISHSNEPNIFKAILA